MNHRINEHRDNKNKEEQKEVKLKAVILKDKGSPQAITLEDTLLERENRYGDFIGHAKITQSLKREMHKSRNWDGLSDDKKECFEMLAHKIGRILNGDPEYDDSWRDIMGYTKLVLDELE
jgi:hypothetical protein